ncbi:oxidoreductase [Nocardioides gansuensis]|uniref:Oxidoreductase n=1 Tax=Nocardioides gansuensis TaxID=2138300 RepID=A0A2T8FEC3_9ACTN|nr:zinc-binding dehydrogenase [Nocardioides gansuensis]PVG84057.1 oxidoreductase [Nocardioides gansuensis]
MHAIRLHEFGPPEHLRIEELPDLAPATGQVRIAVEASGVHLLDTTLRQGLPGPMPPPELPTVPGREVAGTVDLVGEGVDPAWLGRPVVAHLGMVPGGYAEQAVTSVDNLIPRDGLDAAAAVALVGTGRTAVAVLEAAAITADDTVLVPAAAGGIGWLAVQAARSHGARVIAAARGAEKTARLKELEPDQVLDYADPGWAELVDQRPSVVLDGVGGGIGRQSLELLQPGGRMVMFGYSSGTPTAFTTDDVVSRSLSVSWTLGPRIMQRPGGPKALARRAVEHAVAGDWAPLVTAYPLAEAARAHRDLEERRTLGKVVLLSR